MPSDSEESIPSEPKSGPSQPRNAFDALMAPKPKPQATPKKQTKSTWGKGRDGLGVYIANPQTFPPSRVLYYTDDFVAINDLYPKSSIHTLLLPRSATHTHQHPFEAFTDPAFLSAVQRETANLRTLVAKELQRRFGSQSAAESARQAVLSGDVEPDEPDLLPPGRDWEAEVMVGIHAHPSMSNLHVHVLSRDMYSTSLRHRKHYNSFNTPFLVDVADFPLAGDDPRLHPGHEGFLRQDLVCWRCGRNFQNHFARLQEHLAVEFEAWKKE